MLRQRKGTKEVINLVKELDAFPKIEEDYQETTSTRGILSIIVFAVIIVLVLSEIRYYSIKELKYEYDVDFDHVTKMKLNVDITVAMKCESIGADVVDSTSRDILTDQFLNEEETWFELTPNQQLYHNKHNEFNKHFKDNYHSLHKMTWNINFKTQMPLREIIPENKPKDACRFYGTLELNKVAGNFHIIFGKSLSFFGNHAHMSSMFDNTQYNFSHRIDHFSIGDLAPGIVYPLNAELKITNDPNYMYQYFIQAVPTEIHSSSIDIDTYQYSVTEQERVLDHKKGSHGLSGIFFKYDISSLKIIIHETHKSYFELLIRLIGIIGGIFSTSLMLNSTYRAFEEFVSSCFTPNHTKIDNSVKETNPFLNDMQYEINNVNLIK